MQPRLSEQSRAWRYLLRLIAIPLSLTLLSCGPPAGWFPCMNVPWAFDRAAHSKDVWTRLWICERVARCDPEGQQFALTRLHAEGATDDELRVAVTVLDFATRPDKDSRLIQLLVHPKSVAREAAIVDLMERQHTISLPEEILGKLPSASAYEEKVLLVKLSACLDASQGEQLLNALDTKTRGDDRDALSQYGSLKTAITQARSVQLSRSKTS